MKFCPIIGVRPATQWLSSGIALLLSSLPLCAQLWVNGGGAGNVRWSRSDNWSPIASPTNNGTANLVFGGTLAKPQGYAPDMDANWNINSLTFASTSTSSYTLGSLGGFTLTVQGGITNNSTLLQSVNNAIALGADQTWNAAAGDLSIGGNVNNSGHTLTVAGAHDTTISGVISGSGGLIKSDSGNLSLLANNLFSGSATINGGTLVVGTVGALGSVSTVTVNGGGTLSLAGTGNRVNNAASVTLHGGRIAANNLSETFGGLNVTANSSIDLTLGGAAGTLTFASGNSMGGALTINNWAGAAHSSGTDDRIFLTAAPSATFLSNVQFAGFPSGGEYLLSGELVPVPEPKPRLLGLLMVGLTCLRFVKRLKPATSSVKRASARAVLSP